jgi:hypothetical protein
MATIYQYDAQGYFVGGADDYGGPLPNNSTRVFPIVNVGYIPRWNGEAWEQVENHKGKQGYLDGKPHTVTDYGPLPAGWSDDPPPQPYDPGPDYEHVGDGVWVKWRYTRKDFLLWCGIDKIAALNAARAAGNVLVETAKDLMMAAEYISIRDPDTVQMLGLLTTPEGGGILTQADVARILAGQEVREPEPEAV